MSTRRELYNDAVKKLSDYVQGVSKEDFIALVLRGGAEAAANTDKSAEEQLAGTSFIKKALDPIIDLIEGGLTTVEILDSLETSVGAPPIAGGNPADAEQLRKYVRFTLPSIVANSKSSTKLAQYGVISGINSYKSGGDKVAKLSDPSGVKNLYTVEMGVPLSVNVTDNRPAANISLEASKKTPMISVVELLNPRIGTSVRDVTGLSIFCSMIPTHIMSRAVPYLTVKVNTPDIIKSQGANVKTNSMNLVRYLRGEATVDFSDPMSMMVAMSGSEIKPKPGGMELFTSPQTLVSDLDDLSSANYGNFKPIDRFRPFMTLNDVSFEVVSAGAGMMSYKQASMSLTLHDRGRLSEISSFVKPGAYSTTEVEIEYGWSIDPKSASASSLSQLSISDDAFAQFIDSLRLKEKYVVVNSTFQFDDAGQVNISLTLSMKGASDIRSYDISDDIGKAAKTELKKLIEDIQKLINQTNGRAEALFGETVMSAVASPESALNLDTEQLEKIRAAVTKLKNASQRKGDDFTQIQQGLEKVFAKKGAAAKVSGNDEVKRMLDSLVSTPEIFPCCEETAKNGKASSASISKNLTSQGKAYKNGSVSLGKVLLAFVAKPLSRSGNYDEIQLIFNKINSRAGFVRNLSMAAFPLDKEKLDKTLKELYSKNVSVSMSQLIAVIGDEHVANVAYPAYGHSSAYNDKGEYQKVNKTTEGQDYVDQQLLKAGIADCGFQLPRLSVIPECVPHRIYPEKTILRLHVTDGSCTPYQTYSDVISAGRSDSAFLVDAFALSSDHKLFQSIYWADLDPAEAGKIRQSEIKMMQDKEVLTVAAKTPSQVSPGQSANSYQLDLSKLFTTGDPKKVKKFFSESLPVIRYGNAAGMVKNISVSSISDPQLATINILKQDEGSGDSEGSSREKGLPLIVAPTEVSVDMLGCPILNFGQTAYIDFGTNTTIDNIYLCTNLSHKLSPGDFTTTAKFTLNVGAYGVYNSSKRSVDLTKQMVAQLTSGNPNDVAAAEALTTTKYSTGLDFVWGVDIGNGITVEAIEAKYKELKKSKKLPIELRFWSSSAASKSYKASLSKTAEINISGQSLDINVLAPFAADTDPSITCWVIPFPYPSDGTVGKISGIKYSKTDPPAGTPFTVDMKSYNESLQAIVKKRGEQKKANAKS